MVRDNQGARRAGAPLSRRVDLSCKGSDEARVSFKELSEGVQHIGGVQSSIQNDLHDFKTGEQARRAKGEVEAILIWLSALDFASQQSDCPRQRQPETGRWLLVSAGFQAWLKTKK